MQCPWDKCRQLKPLPPYSPLPSLHSCLYEVFQPSGNWLFCRPVVWLLFYPTLMMSVCRAKPQIATWLPVLVPCQSVAMCTLPLPLLFVFPTAAAVVALNKSKEIAFNVYLQQIKIKSIAWPAHGPNNSQFSSFFFQHKLRCSSGLTIRAAYRFWGV